MENMMPYVNVTNEKDFLNMDTLERIRSVSESSMGGTSGYNSTTSPGPENSPNSSRYSPIQSPDSVLQTEFSQLVIPSLSYQPQPQNTSEYVQLQNVHMNLNNNNNNNNQQGILFYQQQQQQQQQHNQNMNFSPHLNFGNPLNFQQQPQQQFQQPTATPTPMSYTNIKYEYEATLRITEQPLEKFRFRYKSEMHGTHGSLNGTNSQRNTKTFPEVELCGYKGPAIIRCSLFQTNLDSPHSHQLVVRKDDHDICDPHELKVSQDVGYFAEFKNMGIIHTAKKFIVEELLKKKRKRLGREVLTTKEDQELHKQTEKEAKDMNLNQVRLCFEAFRVEENKSYTPIAAPVYSNTINNRKSAQTGELRITRLSIATGNVGGGDDLILLVEKVSKKNIKVRFYEMVDDEQVWESFATFRESDVHHQYAIVCRTPAYKDKDIDKAVEVFIELVRPSDDERSYPPVSFRYKPSAAAISRKRRRTCSSFNSGSCSNSGSLSSGDLPKTIQDQQKIFNKSDELKELLNSGGYIKTDVSIDSELLAYLDDPNIKDLETVLTNMESGIGRIEKDGVCSTNEAKNHYHYKKSMISKKQMDLARQQSGHQPLNIYLQRILNIFQDTIRSATPLNAIEIKSAAEQITKIINEHSEKYGESLIHEIVLADNKKFAIPIFKVLDYFNLNELLNTLLNKRTQTALHYACLYGQPTYIRPLLKLGCNPNIQDIDGNTALHIAVHEKHLKCLESFINSQMTLNLNYLNDDGFTPLHLAIRDNNYDIVAKLLKYDSSTVTTPCSKDGSNALHMAVQQQNLKLVNLILDNSPLKTALLYANNRSGYMPLDLAKQLVTGDEQGKQILSVLLTFYNKYPSHDKSEKMDINTSTEDDDDNDEHQLVIKEEENSCSSTEDDEEDNSSNLSANDAKTTATTTNQPKIMKPTEIKQEIPDDNATITAASSLINAVDLELALNNKETFTKLSAKLNENDNWKKLALAMNMPHFYLTNAQAFLNSLKRNIKSLNYTQFNKELRNIDKSLIDLLNN